ncbi:aldehyde dehydrogenase [Aspergillus steynii IBT 23096]|uniref:Aldehyde dehydrogenase n=1 Tax=Aspergillus steynii IBT 23096 TaxID=1392250 RepID=A0A2I2GAP5_9EURO|nr:aldehyde dehydrogenase [Aspergillus steynii IBT 23096]PLB49951.1 aldehyde dehydrogenase [Aspergillus steynii IBT 23096]
MKVTPLLIHGEDTLLSPPDRLDSCSASTTPFQGVTPDLALQAVKSSEQAFPSWSKTPPAQRRHLLNKVASLVEERSDELTQCMQEEMHAPTLWAKLNVQAGIDLLRETAGLISDSMAGHVPVSQGDSYAMVLKEPLGVVLAMVPWNAPVILGLRGVVAPLAAGNTVVLKGSELSPRTHYLLACLFRDAGVPPGVVNFILHRPEDAAVTFETMIGHPAIRKCNFTGSTNVGRIIASKAAWALKPVLLELGGKNFALVLNDADSEFAAGEIVKGAFLNNGQICMSTDLVFAVGDIADTLVPGILSHLETIKDTHTVISPASKQRLQLLVDDARAKGASIHQAKVPALQDAQFPATVIEGLTPDMEFFSNESFGPVVGIVRVQTETEAMDLIQRSTYGLSAAIFTRAHFKALKLAESVRAGAIHVNGMTVHDEATLPHGGQGESGWGRFGAKWGIEEFLQTKTIILNP